jgi:hypothetical protein
MDSPKSVIIDDDVAGSWLSDSLAQGFEISTAVLKTIAFNTGNFRSFIAASDQLCQTNLAEGGVAKSQVAQVGLAQYLDELANGLASCVVVEDDLRRRTDPTVAPHSISTAFIGDRIVHWCELERGTGTDCVDVINKGASGYPLNAFVCKKSAADLGLVDGREAVKDFAGQVAESLLAVVVAAFDAETFLVWGRT